MVLRMRKKERSVMMNVEEVEDGGGVLSVV